MHDDLDHIIVLTSVVSDKKIEGIVNNHAYSMLKSYKYNDSRIYKIRNPWGRFQWKGMFGQNQPIWTEELKNKLDYKDADDGVFFCTQEELLHCFCYYSVSMIKPTFNYNYESFEVDKEESIFLTFDLKQTTEMNLRVTQPFKRMIQDQSYEYSSLIFETGKIESDGTVTYIDQGHSRCTWGAKSCHFTQKVMGRYETGKYFVNVKMLWKQPQKYNKCVVVSYASADVKFDKISKD